MRLFQPDPRERRLMGALFAITFVVTVLLTAFFQTQVVRGEQFAVRSEENRLRPVVIPAPRGTITDRYGELVATSIPGFSLTLLPGEAETVRRTLEDLAPFLGLAGTQIEQLMQQRARRPHDLLTVTEDATYAQVAAIEERRTSFPNLLVVDRPKRYYPAGDAIGHIIGYVAEISREELELPRIERRLPKHVLSVEDAWTLLSTSFTAHDLEQFRTVVMEVLTELDPVLDMASGDRWKAGISGIQRRFSHTLRKGLAESFALFGVTDSTIQGTGGDTTAQFARLIVREILEQANADASYRLWLSLVDVLSLLAEAADRGVEVHVWYVALESADLHVQRVRARVAAGGHDIPEERIRARYDSSRENLIRLLPKLSSVHVFDNSRPPDAKTGIVEPKSVLKMESGRIHEVARDEDIPQWAYGIVAAARRLTA
jgi:predicted ABC-type ATPase